MYVRVCVQLFVWLCLIGRLFVRGCACVCLVSCGFVSVFVYRNVRVCYAFVYVYVRLIVCVYGWLCMVVG